MALSQWDMKYLNPDQQAEVLNYQNQWGSDPSQRDSLHSVVEGIRGQAGYSGGVDGSQYIPVESYKGPSIPTIPEYESPYGGVLDDLMDQVKNPPKYQSPYEDLINDSISNIVNRDPFSYDADSDTAYQAYLQRATAAGDKAYADNLGGMSAMTGGRPNSWAGTVASQARNQYVLQAQEAVIQFEDRAYNRYQNETQDMYNMVDMLNNQDQSAYSRYRDSITDTKDYADMVMRLDDRDFQRYQQKVDNSFKIFDAETKQYEGALNFKKDQIAQAIDRTQLNGYVNNQDSIVLGVPAGTLSQSARERAEQMEDYILKSEHDLETYKKQKEVDYDFDMKLVSAKAMYDGGSGGSGGGYSGEDTSFQPNTTEANKITGVSKDFSSLVNSKDFTRLSPKEKYDAINNFIDSVVNDVDKNMYGKNSLTVGREIISRITSDPAYKKYVIGYEKMPEVEEEIKSIGQPGFSMNNFLLKKSR